MALSDAPIIELDTIDSTNNYAMELIDADTAQPGLTIVTRLQTQGKGQRGRQWLDAPDQSLLMSIIISPNRPVEEQFVFNMSVAIAIAEVLQQLYEGWRVHIKWPNDIIINDKKAGGILIENVLRGSSWLYSVVGLGLNVLQQIFPLELPYATSLKIASGKDFVLKQIRDQIRGHILEKTSSKIPAGDIIQQYNSFLYRRGHQQSFTDDTHEWSATIQAVSANGMLRVQLADGTTAHYTHGTVTWKWQ